MDNPDQVTTIRILTGHGVSREFGTLTVIVEGDRVLWASTGQEIRILREAELIGWGDLSGPAYDVQPYGCAWSVSVPKSVWDGLTL